MALHIERLVYTLDKLEKTRSHKIGDRPLQAKICVEARVGAKERIDGEEMGADKQLSASYRRIYDKGNEIYPTLTVRDIQRRLVSKEVAIRDKRKNINGLQIADLVCFPMHWNTLFELCPNEVRQLQGRIEKDKYVSQFWKELRCKIAADKHGRVRGYGMKLFPDRE